MVSAAFAGLILSWTLFAFGAVYPWANEPAAAATLILFLLARPRVFRHSTLALDTSLVLFLAWCWLQFVPLPPGLVNALSPANGAFIAAVRLTVFDPNAWRPLSLAPAASMHALIVLTAGALFYWVVRDGIGGAGSRFLARWIAINGAVCVVLAALSPVLFPNGLVYGFWHPIARSAQPLGPMISRNHFASWMLLAAPIAGGYLAVRAEAHWAGRSLRQSSLRALTDGRTLAIGAAIALIVGGVLISQSRAGLIGLSAAGLIALVGSWRQLHGRGRLALLALTTVLAISALMISNPARVVNRLGDLAEDDWGLRPMVWRAAGELVSRYRLTGVGYGAFEGAMPYYQPEPRGVMINHAHNQYLNLLAETGIPGILLALSALILLVRLHFQRQRQDRSSHRHLRAGAIVGLIGLAVQSIWEVPLLTAGVLWLAATAAGLATSRPATGESSPGAR
jgi:O-antigen ligase